MDRDRARELTVRRPEHDRLFGLQVYVPALRRRQVVHQLVYQPHVIAEVGQVRPPAVVQRDGREDDPALAETLLDKERVAVAEERDRHTAGLGPGLELPGRREIRAVREAAGLVVLE